MKLATLLECPTSHPAHLEACLQQADPGKISSKQYDVVTQPTILAYSFVPVVDGDFLPDEVEVCVGVCFCVCGGWVGYVANVPIAHETYFLCALYVGFLVLPQLADVANVSNPKLVFYFAFYISRLPHFETFHT